MRWRRGWIVAAVAAWICGDAAYAVTIQASGEGEPQQAIHYGLDESGRRWRVDDHGDPQAVAWNPDFGPWQKALELGLDDDSDSDSDGSLELVEFTLAERVVIEGTDWVDWHEIITTDGVSWKLEAPEILVDGEAASVTPIGGGGDFEFFFDDHGRRRL